jgi:hypothetical protein
MYAFLIHNGQVICDLAVLSCLFLFYLRPYTGDSIFTTVERIGAQFAKKKRLAIISVAVLVVLIRISLPGMLVAPVPTVQDEFSYLLAGDTIAHGHVTNPPHPMWVFFETFNINQQPTYMSKYPPAQGAVLAVGQLVGHAWVGVILSVAVMCGAILWMLQGWLPPRWALLGALLVVFRLGIFTFWMNSYWGAAVPAIGGALVVGALPRIRRFQRPIDAVLLGIGAAILANSRPMEGFILCIPVIGVLVWWLCSRQSPPWRITFPRFVLPFSAVMLLCAVFIGYYNWRGTGHALLFPYALNDQTYWAASPTLFWEKVRPSLHYLNPQFENFYNVRQREWWLQGRVNSVGSAVTHMVWLGASTVYFYFWRELCVPLLLIPSILLDRRVRFLIVQTGICFFGLLPVPWVQARYLAPLTATLFLLVVQAIRHLRHWEPLGRPVGVAFSRALFLLAILLAPFHPLSKSLQRQPPEGIEFRAQFESQLNTSPGGHLMIVRYSPEHSSSVDWVYNAADIDHAKVIWAREIPGMDIHPLLDYFHGRHVWLVEPDATPPSITPYSEIAPSQSNPNQSRTD